MSGPCTCSLFADVTPDGQELFALPAIVCACDLARFTSRFVAEGWKCIFVAAPEITEVLRATGYPVLWLPTHVGQNRALVWEWWGDAWAVNLLGEWESVGFRLFLGMRVNTSLEYALRRGTDAEFRAAVSTVLTYGGARALSEYLAARVLGEHKP